MLSVRYLDALELATSLRWKVYDFVSGLLVGKHWPHSNTDLDCLSVGFGQLTVLKANHSVLAHRLLIEDRIVGSIIE